MRCNSEKGKKVIAFLMAFVLMTMCSVNVFAFTPRTTAPSASTYDKGNPYSKGQCTWYAWGRAREILGKTPKTWMVNAGAWYSYNESQNWYSWGSSPKAGAIMVTRKKGCASDIGHVAVVETISGSKMTISEYNWSASKGFSTATLDVNAKTRGKHEVIGYIYLLNEKPSQPAINEVSDSDITSTSIKISWNSVSGATKYKVVGRRSDQEYSDLTTTTETSYTQNNLTPGETYYYKVYAQNDTETSEGSVAYEVHTPPQTPSKPTAEQVTAIPLIVLEIITAVTLSSQSMTVPVEVSK